MVNTKPEPIKLEATTWQPPNLVALVDNYYEGQRKSWPVRNNRASQIGHPCERYLYYLRMHGHEMEPPNLDLQYIFEEGNRQERAVAAILNQAGIDYRGAPISFEWRDGKELLCTGTMDGLIVGSTPDALVPFELPMELLQGKLQGIPVEIKSSSPFSWESLHDVDDLRKADPTKRHWLRGYYAQVQAYLVSSEKPVAWIIFKNKQTGRLKFFLITMDWDFLEVLRQKCLRINQSIETEHPPGRYFEPGGPHQQHAINVAFCAECKAWPWCQPKSAAKATWDVMVDEQVAELVETRLLYAAAGKTHSKADSAFKAAMAAHAEEAAPLDSGIHVLNRLLPGGYLVTGKRVPRTKKEGYDGGYHWRWEVEVVDEDN